MFENIKSYYENYDEDGRLFRDNAHKVEYLTTIRYFDRLFAPDSKILDVCAGTGIYSFYLANKGHKVTACDLVEHNVNIIKSKSDADKLIDIDVCNVLDLSRFNENYFDVVLCMGAIYHLSTDELRQRAVSECVRVCKPGGIIVLAYITKIGAIFDNITEDIGRINALVSEILDETVKYTFTFATPHEIENIAVSCGLEKICHIGVDGMAYTICDKLNNTNEEIFQEYIKYHYKTCEDESILGASLHGLLFGRKT